MESTKKIELIEQDDGSWFWCILEWNKKNKGWYNLRCGNSVDSQTAVGEAFAVYNGM